jgi:hypothetical protein
MGTAIGVICFVLVDLIMVWTIISWGFRRQWNSLAKDFPPLEVVEPSVTKSFQTFRVNSMNLGNCIHVTLDDRSLHLNPAKMLRWMGMLPVSIPWEFVKRIEPHDANSIFRLSPKFRRVKIGSVDVTGPAWCFQLVFGEETPLAEEKSPLSQ